MVSEWTKQRVEMEIRKRKRSGHPLNVRAVKTLPLHWHALRLFGSWEKAIRSTGIDYDKIRLYRVWTKPDILNWIRREHKLGHDIRPGTIQEHEPALFAAASRRFGGWYSAIRAAGIRGFREVKPRRWDVRKLIRALQEFGAEAPYTMIKAKDPALLPALRVHFGSYSSARRAAGFVPKLPRRRRLWPREKILGLIRSRAKTHPHLRTRDFADLGGMWTAAMDIFGSWPNAVRAAGFTYVKNLPRTPWKWTLEQIHSKIRAAHEAGTPLRISTFEGGLVTAAMREFGSWHGALRALGLPPPPRETKWTRERILAAIRAKAEGGVCPRHAKALGSGVYQAACRRFGSWEGAARAAGLRPAPRAWKWPRERILAQVRSLARRGVRLTQSGSLYAALRRTFGRVGSAKKAAGVSKK